MEEVAMEEVAMEEVVREEVAMEEVAAVAAETATMDEVAAMAEEEAAGKRAETGEEVETAAAKAVKQKAFESSTTPASDSEWLKGWAVAVLARKAEAAKEAATALQGWAVAAVERQEEVTTRVAPVEEAVKEEAVREATVTEEAVNVTVVEAEANTAEEDASVEVEAESELLMEAVVETEAEVEAEVETKVVVVVEEEMKAATEEAETGEVAESELAAVYASGTARTLPEGVLVGGRVRFFTCDTSDPLPSSGGPFGVHTRHAASVGGHRLAFTVRHTPPLEPSLAVRLSTASTFARAFPPNLNTLTPTPTLTRTRTCTLITLTLTQSIEPSVAASDVCEGALYELSREGYEALRDVRAGAPHQPRYEEVSVSASVGVSGERLTALTLQVAAWAKLPREAPPSTRYKRSLIEGGRALGLSAEALGRLDDTPSVAPSAALAAIARAHNVVVSLLATLQLRLWLINMLCYVLLRPQRIEPSDMPPTLHPASRMFDCAAEVAIGVLLLPTAALGAVLRPLFRLCGRADLLAHTFLPPAPPWMSGRAPEQKAKPRRVRNSIIPVRFAALISGPLAALAAMVGRRSR